MNFKRCNSLLIVSLVFLWEATTIVYSVHPDILQGDQRVRVEIDNVLSSPVTVHCKSKDNDLGVKTMNPHEFYAFDFKVNFFGTTLFFCGVNYECKQVVFDVYKASRDQNRCLKFCEWHVNTEGMEGFSKESSSKPDIVIPWK